MPVNADSASGRLKQHAKAWLRARADECTTCRDCGADVGPWDECCGNCGRGNPARVASSAAVAVVVVVGFVLIGVIATALI